MLKIYDQFGCVSLRHGVHGMTIHFISLAMACISARLEASAEVPSDAATSSHSMSSWLGCVHAEQSPPCQFMQPPDGATHCPFLLTTRKRCSTEAAFSACCEDSRIHSPMLQYIWTAWLRTRGGLAAHEAVYDSFNDRRAIPIKLMRAT